MSERKRRFYRVDGSFDLVTPAEWNRRARLQERAAEARGRVIIRDRKGRPRSIAPDEAEAEAKRRAKSSTRIRNLPRDESGRIVRPEIVSAIVRLANVGASIGKLTTAIMDTVKRMLRYLRRAKREGVIEIQAEFLTGRTATMIWQAFPPYAPIEAGHNRSLLQLEDELDADPRVEFINTITLAAPSGISDRDTPDKRPPARAQRADARVEIKLPPRAESLTPLGLQRVTALAIMPDGAGVYSI